MAINVIESERAIKARGVIRRDDCRGKRIGRMRMMNAAMGMLLCAPAVGFSAEDAAALAAKYSCQGCHALDRKVLGPSYKDIAARYAGDSGALDKLQQKVKTGGSGVWGPIPMPPNNVPDDDRKALVKWILEAK